MQYEHEKINDLSLHYSYRLRYQTWREIWIILFSLYPIYFIAYTNNSLIFSYKDKDIVPSSF